MLTPGMLLLLLIIGWLAVMWYAGKFAVRASGKRWARWPAILVTLWLPLWDVVPGYLMYREAVKELGGVQIHQQVTAEGYLSAHGGFCGECWTQLNSTQYRYLEFEIAAGVADRLVASPGFYQFEYEPEISARCTPLDGLQDAAFVRRTVPSGKCLVATRRDAPVSRYHSVSSGGWQPLNPSAWSPVEISWDRIDDRAAGKPLAVANRLRFVSWISRRILFPRWEYTQTEAGRPLWFRVEDVVRPAT